MADRHVRLHGAVHGEGDAPDQRRTVAWLQKAYRDLVSYRADIASLGHLAPNGISGATDEYWGACAAAVFTLYRHHDYER